MRSFKVILAIGFVVLFGCVRANAASGPGAQGQTVFEKMDGPDGDGKITRQEHAESRVAWFKGMDANGDGTVSEDEFLAGEFLVLDGPDQDGTVTEEEYAIYFVGKDAVEKYKKTTVPGKRDPNKFGFDGMDADGDGVVTVEEFIVVHKGLFGEMDSNGDGKVTKDEFESYRKARVKLGDKNKDGKLDKQEFTPQKAAPSK